MECKWVRQWVKLSFNHNIHVWCNEVKIEESEKAGSSWESNPGHLPPSQGQLTRSQLPLGELRVPLPLSPSAYSHTHVYMPPPPHAFQNNIYRYIQMVVYSISLLLVSLAHLLICSLLWLEHVYRCGGAILNHQGQWNIYCSTGKPSPDNMLLVKHL